MPLPKDFLANYKTSVFIETGSHRGDGIQRALEAGFEAIYSVEISPFCYGWCSYRFRDQRDKVDLHLGDSVEFLKRFLPTLTTRATFWIDAHWCGGDGEMQGKDADLEKDAPLLKELRLIRKHDVEDHIILIDDVRLFGTHGYPSKESILKALHKVNPDYTISYHDSLDYELDILAARIL